MLNRSTGAHLVELLLISKRVTGPPPGLGCGFSPDALVPSHRPQTHVRLTRDTKLSLGEDIVRYFADTAASLAIFCDDYPMTGLTLFMPTKIMMSSLL